MRHPGPEALLDMVEGTAVAATVAHVAGCAFCQAQVARLDRALAEAAAVDVPEPSPLFWNHLSSRVREAIAAEPPPSSKTQAARWWMWPIGVATGVAVVWLAIGVPFRGLSEVPATAVTVPHDLADATGASGGDPSLAWLGDLASDLDWDGVAEVGWTMPTGTIDRAVVDLSAEERVELRRILVAELNASEQSL